MLTLWTSWQDGWPDITGSMSSASSSPAKEGRAGEVQAGRRMALSYPSTRVLADAGDGDAQRQLADWLARRGDIDELRQRANGGDEYARQQLANSPQG